jgi:hypothetical protein
MEPDLYCDEIFPTAWRGFKQPVFPEGSWRFLKDGTLQSLAEGEPVDLMTIDEYESFELELEWRVSLGGNTGVLYRVSESAARAWQSGPEMQLVDDGGHPDGEVPETSAGALYGLIAPQLKILRPAGTFNSARIVALPDRVEHWLNNGKVVEYDPESESFSELVSKSKFKGFPDFGRVRPGHIVLQHHGNTVWFRNIRIRRLQATLP